MQRLIKHIHQEYKESRALHITKNGKDPLDDGLSNLDNRFQNKYEKKNRKKLYR
jgi:hypothetical protein